MLEEAQAFIESGDVDSTCDALQQAHLRADGDSPPPDFVTGPAVANLADLILALMSDLECSSL